VWLAAAPARQVCVWTGVDALRVWARGAIDLCIQSLGFICSTSISSHSLTHVAYVRLQCSCWKTSAQHEAASSCLTGQQTCFIGAPGALQCCQLIICPHLCCACACLLCTSTGWLCACRLGHQDGPALSGEMLFDSTSTAHHMHGLQRLHALCMVSV
jgi:hypothetical protein